MALDTGDIAMSAEYPRAVTLAVTCAFLLSVPAAAAAQYTVEAENGDTVQFESAALRVMLDTARALYADLQEDPRVLYYTPLDRETVSLEDPEASYPWNVITVISDSVADLQRLPANLREADRAYYNYAVQRMRVVRGADPDVSCDSLLALEQKAVESFIDGWVLSRTLFGGPPFPPLDELVFARRDGLLRALLARHNDPQVGACAGQWAEENHERIEAYDAWREERFPASGEAEEGADPEAVDATPSDSIPSPDSGVPPTDPAGTQSAAARADRD
jgi:hypothetical protein